MNEWNYSQEQMAVMLLFYDGFEWSEERFYVKRNEK